MAASAALGGRARARPRRACAVLAFGGLWLAGCATRIEADVARFHGPAAELVPGRVVVVPRDAELAGSLEFRQYAGLVQSALAARGFTPVARADGADYVAALAYGVSEGREVLRSVPRGPHGYPPYPADYPYAYPGPGYELESATVFTRLLELDIVATRGRDAEGTRPVVFEGRVKSVGRDDRLPELMPYLVDALFEGFPGPSGETTRVVIDVPRARGLRD